MYIILYNSREKMGQTSKYFPMMATYRGDVQLIKNEIFFTLFPLIQSPVYRTLTDNQMIRNADNA